MFQKLIRKVFHSSDTGTQVSVETENMLRRVNWPTFVFGVFGLLISVYSFIEYIRIKSTNQLGKGCIINADSTCGGVAATGYGTFFGVPVVSLGIAFWAIVIVFSMLPKLELVSKKLFVSWRLVISFLGFLFVIRLYYVATFVADLSCIVCSLAQIVSTIFFIFSMYVFLFHLAALFEFRSRGIKKFLVVSAKVSIPLLVIGIGVPAFMEWKRTKPVTVSQIGNIDDSFPAEWWSVQGKDEDGDGEDYRAGNDDARVNIQIFTDPTCIECGQAQAAIGSAMEAVGADKVLFVVKFLPQDADCNRYAETQGVACRVSVASRCAGRQGRFFEYLAWAYEGQEKTPVEQNTLYSQEGLRLQAVRFGLNANEFTECTNSTVELVKIRDDVENANKMGEGYAPLVIINGRVFEGNMNDPIEIATAMRFLLK